MWTTHKSKGGPPTDFVGRYRYLERRQKLRCRLLGRMHSRQRLFQSGFLFAIRKITNARIHCLIRMFGALQFAIDFGDCIIGLSDSAVICIGFLCAISLNVECGRFLL